MASDVSIPSGGPCAGPAEMAVGWRGPVPNSDAHRVGVAVTAVDTQQWTQRRTAHRSHTNCNCARRLAKVRRGLHAAKTTQSSGHTRCRYQQRPASGRNRHKSVTAEATAVTANTTAVTAAVNADKTAVTNVTSTATMAHHRGFISHTKLASFFIPEAEVIVSHGTVLYRIPHGIVSYIMIPCTDRNTIAARQSVSGSCGYCYSTAVFM